MNNRINYQGVLKESGAPVLQAAYNAVFWGIVRDAIVSVVVMLVVAIGTGKACQVARATQNDDSRDTAWILTGFGVAVLLITITILIGTITSIGQIDWLTLKKLVEIVK